MRAHFQCAPFTPEKTVYNYRYLASLNLIFHFVPKPVDLWLWNFFSTWMIISIVLLPNINPVPPCGENGQCAQKKYISLLPLLAQCRSGSVFFFFFPYTLSKRAYMEGRRKKASHSCTGPRVERGKCIFSGCIVRFLHKMVLNSYSLTFWTSAIQGVEKYTHGTSSGNT